MDDKNPIEQIKELAPLAHLEVELDVASHNAAVLKSKVDYLETILRSLFELLDRIEESDEGRVFRPVQIYCCRELDCLKLEGVLAQLKNLIEGSGGPEKKEELLEVGRGSIIKAMRNNRK